MIYLRSIEFRNHITKQGFPFNLPVIENWNTLSFDSQVVFFAGENGSGKSTILETIACASGSITIGSESVKIDPTLSDARTLAESMRLTWNVRTRRGFFLRAEDFFGYIKQLSKTRSELEQALLDVEDKFKYRSAFARGQATMPFAREINDLQNRYGEGLDVHSHGESYLELFQSRFVPGGLYLLDEPEAALSPLRQLGFLSLLKEMVNKESQFIIATHSPILMAFPEAKIMSFDHVPLKEIPWEQLEHVTLTRDFLNSPSVFLRHL